MFLCVARAGIEPARRGFKVLRPAIRRSPNAAPDAVRGRKRWCRGPDLNWGHRNFQSRALPTELPRRKSAQRSIYSLWRMPPQQWVPYAIGQPLYTGRAGDENRTHDLLLGKETFYRWTTPALWNHRSRSDYTATAHILQSGPGRIRTDDLLRAKEAPSR